MSADVPGQTDDPDPPIRVSVHPGKEAVVEFDPALTFECVDRCSWCCQHGVLLYDEDFRELAKHADLNESTTGFRGERFVRRDQKGRADHAAEDGAACYFLTADGRCALQADHDWKPTRCSVFPLAVRRENGDIRVDVRDSAWEHCDGLYESDRRVIDNLDAFLPELLWELDDPETRREL